MSVAQLQRPEVSGWVTAARSSVGSAATVEVDALSVDELTDGIAGLAVLEAQVGELRLRLLAEADRRQVARSLGATGTDAWAAALTGTTRAVMAGGIWLARLLADKYPATREAFADGGLNQDQARVIVQAAEDLPAGVTEDQRRAAEAGLVAKAVNGMDARRLRQAARRMLDTAAVEIAADRARAREHAEQDTQAGLAGLAGGLADEHEAALLEAEERRAEVETWLSLADNGDGTFSGRFVIPELHGNLLRSWLDQITSPDRLSRNRAGTLVHDDSLPGGGPGLNRTETLGLGFTELIEHLPTAATGGFARNAVSLLVHLDYQHLLDSLASARLDTGVHISAGTARRLACNAGLIPAVLGTRSEPLDLGREARLHNTAQRRALSITHDSCAAEGCERPFAWCDIHHPRSWAHGGPTNLTNALPLCGFHHQRAHDTRFDLHHLPTGEVRFTRRR